MSATGFTDEQTARLAERNLKRKQAFRQGFRNWNETKSTNYRTWNDSYGNVYQHWPFVKPFKAAFTNSRTGRRKSRIFAKRKTMMKWIEGLYWKNQHGYEAAQKKKAERSQARAVYRQEHQPTKLQVIEEKISKAEQHKKELETRIKRLRTAVKKSNRRIAGLKVALRKAVLPKEAA